jgi:predicted metalloprotease
MTYEEPNMVLFSAVNTGVGMQPLIQVRFIVLQIKKYIWITPFEELKTRFGAQGGILQPHVMLTRDRTSCANFNGNLIKMRQLQQGKSKAEANKLSVALELQADFMLVYGRITTKK